MIYKIGFAIMIIVAAIYGLAFLFNHVNPWLGVFATIAAITILAGLIHSIAKDIIRKQNQNQEQ